MIRRMAILAFVVFLPATAWAQGSGVKKTGAAVTDPSDGKQMFASYCAPCHGRGGKGDGPAAAALNPRPADLTAFARKRGGTFSEKDFQDRLQGMTMSPAHGTSEMPVWGPIFAQLGNDQMRVYNLTNYVEALQAR